MWVGLLAVGYEKYGNEAEFARNAFQHLFNIYVKVNEDMDTNPEIDEIARYAPCIPSEGTKCT